MTTAIYEYIYLSMAAGWIPFPHKWKHHYNDHCMICAQTHSYEYIFIDRRLLLTDNNHETLDERRFDGREKILHVRWIDFGDAYVYCWETKALDQRTDAHFA